MLKKMLSVLSVLALCAVLCVTAFAAEAPRLYDGADLLTDSEESTLLQRLDSTSEKYRVDIVIALMETIGDYSADDYTKAFYHENGYGYGEGRDGVLLLIDMEERDYRIFSYGPVGEAAISYGDCESIGDQVASFLSDGEYYTAFGVFIDECAYQIDGEINGFPFDYTTNILISLGIGFVVALIVTGSMKGKLKSVIRRNEASEYTKAGSMHVTDANDLFLYRTVTRQEKPKESSSSSRSSGSGNISGGKF